MKGLKWLGLGMAIGSFLVFLFSYFGIFSRMYPRTAQAQERVFYIMTIKGKSMYPTLRNGDRVLCLKEPPSFYNRGDVVAFPLPERVGNLEEGTLISHRIYLEHDSTVSTLGDNNRIADPYKVNRSNIICEAFPSTKRFFNLLGKIFK